MSARATGMQRAAHRAGAVHRSVRRAAAVGLGWLLPLVGAPAALAQDPSTGSTPTAAASTAAASTAAASTAAASTAAAAVSTGRTAAAWADRVLGVRSVLGADGARWSPDGRMLTFTSSLGDGRGLWGVPATGGFPVRLVPDLGGVPFLLAQHPRWSPTGAWISYLTDRDNENGQPDLWIWSPRDGRQVRLTRMAARIGWTSWSPDGRWVALAAGTEGNYDVWKVSVPDGRLVRLTDDPRYETTPEWSPDGRRVVFVRSDARWVDHEILEVPADGGTPRRIVEVRDFFDYQTSGTPLIGAPQLSPDGRTLLYLSWQSGWINYWTVPVAGGTPRAVAPAPADQSDAAWSPDGRTVAFVENRDGTRALRLVPRQADGSFGEPRTLVGPPMGVVANVAWAPDGSRVGYTLATPTAAADLYVADPRGGAPTRLTWSDGAGEADALVAPRKVRYRSDTLTISAYLYTPRDLRPGERRPAILFAHGGPTSQYADGYEPQMQFFAAQGYVILAPNFRGSSGYGRAFADANDRCWAHCDLDDLVAGKAYLATLGYVDTARVGMTGTSHGGLLSMAAATFAKGAFRATIPHGGTADRIYYYNTQELRHIKQAEHEFGPLADNEAVYRYVSPYYHVEQVDTPQFVIWGEGRWPGSQNSRRYVEELERQYKPHRWKVYQGENYYVSSRANVRQMLLDMLDFFDVHLREAP